MRAGPPPGGNRPAPSAPRRRFACQILRGDPVRLVLETGDEISPGTGEQRSQSDPHPVESALQVDRGATGVQERRRQVLEAGGGCSAGQVPGEPEDHRVGGSNPDRRSAANDHVADGLPNLAGFGALDPDLFRGEPALVQQSEDPALGVPPERTNHGNTLAVRDRGARWGAPPGRWAGAPCAPVAMDQACRPGPWLPDANGNAGLKSPPGGLAGVPNESDRRGPGAFCPVRADRTQVFQRTKKMMSAVTKA